MVKLVGVINVTPDSFSDGGLFIDPALALQQADRLFEDGADLIDVGAESTKPGAQPVSIEQEWQRLDPVLHELLARYPGKISLDSRHPDIIRQAMEIGPVIINDVTGMHDPAMIAVAAEYDTPVIVSHLAGSGTDIQAVHAGTLVDSVVQVRDELLVKAAELQAAGINKSRIILDPGIGFGKTMETNWRLLTFGEIMPEYPVMIGPSRKRFLGEHRMENAPNNLAAAIAAQYGAQFLRMHDIAATQTFLMRII